MVHVAWELDKNRTNRTQHDDRSTKGTFMGHQTHHLFSTGATRLEPAKAATNREGAMNEGPKIGPQRVLMALILKYRDEGEGLKGASRQEDLLGPKEAKGAQRGRSSRPQRKLHRYLIRNCLNYASKASKADQKKGQIGAKGANLARDSG
jgi:hypothetical protein